MSSPARDERLLSIALGYTQVHRRGSNSISMRNPTTNKIRAVYGIGHGWHYGAGLETDTAWEADSDSNYLKMVKAGYNLRARKLFNAGDLIQYIDPGTGQYVKFQPVNFQWIDGTTGSNSIISVAQAISTPTVDDDKLYWPAAFGTGRHFRYTASPTRLIKHLIIDGNPDHTSNLPTCPSYITNPYLELTFTLTPSSGVVMYVDGVAWDQATTKTTANAIEFRLPSGQVVWQLAAPTAYDSSEMSEPCQGQIKLYVNKKIKYCSVRFPKSWIDAAVFPITLDPTLDYQVGAGGNDGNWYGTSFVGNGTVLWLGHTLQFSLFSRFTGVTIPAGATIDAAHISYCYNDSSGTPPACSLYFEDAADPTAVTSAADGNSRTLTTSTISITPPTSGTWWDSNSIAAIIQELVDSYSYAAGAAMQCLIFSPSSAGYSRQKSYESGASNAPKLHIEYTEAAAGGTWAGTWGG